MLHRVSDNEAESQKVVRDYHMDYTGKYITITRNSFWKTISTLFKD